MFRRLSALKPSTLVLAAAIPLTIAAAGAALVVATSSSTSSTGGYPYADATNCSAQHGTYSWCIGSSDLSPFGYGYRNCTDYVAWKVNQVFGLTLPDSLGNANTWGPRLKADGYSYDTVPRVGDIAAWNSGGGGFGHVAYVYAVDDGIASLDEYNVAGTGLFTSNRTTKVGSAGPPSEFVHIGSPPTNPAPAPAATQAGFVPQYSWKWTVSSSNGYVDKVTYSSAAITHVDSVPVLPGFGSTSAIASACQVSEAADGVIPVVVKITNATPNFPATIQEAIFLNQVDVGFYPNLVLATPGSDGTIDCSNIATVEDQSLNGGGEGGPWVIGSPNQLAPGASTYDYAYLIISNYYSPDQPNGDRSMINTLSLFDQDGPEFASFSGPGVDQGNAQAKGLIDLGGQPLTEFEIRGY